MSAQHLSDRAYLLARCLRLEQRLHRAHQECNELRELVRLYQRHLRRLRAAQRKETS